MASRAPASLAEALFPESAHAPWEKQELGCLVEVPPHPSTLAPALLRGRGHHGPRTHGQERPPLDSKACVLRQPAMLACFETENGAPGTHKGTEAERESRKQRRKERDRLRCKNGPTADKGRKRENQRGDGAEGRPASLAGTSGGAAGRGAHRAGGCPPASWVGTRSARPGPPR